MALMGIEGEFFHVGIRVPDLAAAMDELGASHGVTWASVQDRAMDVWVPDRGRVTLQLALTYSREGPVHLELMTGPADSPWDPSVNPGPHHLGYWCDDVGGETQRLLAQGWTIELAAAPPDDGYGRFTYLRSPNGVLVEPVSSAARPRFEARWAGGVLAPSPTR
jgi:catechol 2,3-dioxygenase-like lactoylglutathione lyase family enzyme